MTTTLKCPACDGQLSTYTAGNVTVDICKERCGGVWFDAGELEKFDEPHEEAPLALLKAIPIQTVVVDRSKTRICPRCNPHAPLQQRIFDEMHQMQIDQCDVCHGTWVDLGELSALRNNNRDAELRRNVINDYFGQAQNQSSGERSKRSLKGVLELLFK